MRSLGNTPVDGEVRAVASGTLPNGKPVIVSADGTVSVVAETAEVIGSPNVFESGNTVSTAATFDSSNNKVVIAYRDGGNSNYGTAIVGTVGASSISFGTAVVFESASTDEIAITFDSSNNKIFIAYKDNGNSGYGTGIVGTVSGTSISFGSAVVFKSVVMAGIGATFDSNSNKVVVTYRNNSAGGDGTASVGTVSGTNISFGSSVAFTTSNSTDTSTVFDSSNNKIVIAYRDIQTTDIGTCVVGTVSGTSISFGTPVVFENAAVTFIAAAFDSNSNKVVISYRVTSTTYGNSIVGTVSGTSISFGTAVVFEAADAREISSTFDTNANKVAVVYRDNGNSFYGTRILGTVSGTSISFNSPVVFESANTSHTSCTFDSTSNNVVIAYRDEGFFDRGTATFFRPLAFNLTSENYIGIAKGAAANGASAVVQTGCSINDAQSSLTAGQQYFVQTDGTLGLTAANPSVLAGTAVSATKLIVKG
tara:strand:+ start:894 stop:2330 length:1437 start_codon:yes stop_codon:yes gene_type:complete